jgi:hypothetical protein
MVGAVNRRLFLKLTSWTGGVGVLAARKPAHRGLQKAKTLLDSGRAGDRLSFPTNDPWSDIWTDLW